MLSISNIFIHSTVISCAYQYQVWWGGGGPANFKIWTILKSRLESPTQEAAKDLDPEWKLPFANIQICTQVTLMIWKSSTPIKISKSSQNWRNISSKICNPCANTMSLYAGWWTPRKRDWPKKMWRKVVKIDLKCNLYDDWAQDRLKWQNRIHIAKAQNSWHKGFGDDAAPSIVF